jgi:sigma54-dependent transcription regulator
MRLILTARNLAYLQRYLLGEYMSKVLLTWIGNTDILASEGQLEGALGPTAEAVLQCSYKDVFLLSDHSSEASGKYKRWLTNTSEAKVTIKQVKLLDPMDFNTIYHESKQLVLEVQEQKGKNTELVFDVSPGTPAMAAVWIILSKTCFPQAELIGTGQKDEVTGKFLIRTISVPFDISAEPIADILGKSDDALVRLLQGLPAEAPEFDYIIHKCSAMKWVIGRARTVALRNVPVLLLGESGTGKELLARAIHEVSQRKGEPFIPENCAAITPTLIESELFGHAKGAFTGAATRRIGLFGKADKGTLFLDEIGDLNSELQCKLLRTLQEGTVRPVGESEYYNIDVRIIAATNKNLIEEIAKGRFREDLFYRLAVGVIKIPPLREREGDS